MATKPSAKRPPPPRAVSEPARLGYSVSFPVNVNSLQAAKIRWFYCEPGKSWIPFNGGDSLSLEDARMHVANSDDINLSQEVVVMGDMYTVDVYRNSASLKPIYWDVKEPWLVRRGMWFEVASKDQWLPLPEEEADIIEEAHTRKEWRQKAKADHELSAWAQTRSQQQQQQQPVVILYQVMLKGYEVVWLGDTEILKVKKDITSRMLSKVGEKLGKGLSYGSMKLMRGYKESAVYSDQLPPIGHLVFAIHGIGQNMESSDIIKSTADLRETCNSVAMKHFPDQWKKKRVEFIPIEWRTWLTLDRGTLSNITLHSVKSLRNIINDSVLDIMYYLSPKYGPEILDGFRWQLNKKYADFVRRHPDFVPNGGTVSLFGHSLGSVMSYDLMYDTCQAKGLLTKQQPIIPKEPSMSIDEEEDSTDNGNDDDLMAFEELHKAKLRVAELEEKLLKKKMLHFNVDHFFAVGSPLGIFIILKEHDNHVVRDYKCAKSFLPSSVCGRIHNLHHPSDPVAYRIEPLINPLYSQIKPVKVDSAGGKSSQKSKDLAEGPRLEEASPPTSRGWFNYVASSVMKNLGSSTTAIDQPTCLPENKVFDDDSKLKPEERLQERLDFMLRESLTENSYFNSLTAHLCYWTSNDAALYILLQIYSYQNK